MSDDPRLLMPLRQSALLHVAIPDVLADPRQVGEFGVWTRAVDVLPGTAIRDGQEVVAAWGALTWRAVAFWDDQDDELLWLRPVTAVAQPLTIRGAYPPHVLADAVLSALSRSGALEESGLGGAPLPRVEELVAAVEAALEGLYGDADGALATLIAALARSRKIAREAVDGIAQQSPCRSWQLTWLRSPAGIGLLGLARRTRPSWRALSPSDRPDD